jgi:hypothetical protein
MDPAQDKSFWSSQEGSFLTPALKSIDYSSELPVILAVDTSKDAVGIVLLQIDKEGNYMGFTKDFVLFDFTW